MTRRHGALLAGLAALAFGSAAHAHDPFEITTDAKVIPALVSRQMGAGSPFGA